MSAHDFQAKCASVMDSALQTAIAETTKLFEAVVDELKAEMSRIKKENDELRARCSGCERVHRAVQCDIIPFCNMLVEQYQPSVQYQHNHQEMVYPFQEHNYDVRGMGHVVVRHESVSSGEEVKSAYSAGAQPRCPAVCRASVHRQADSTQFADLRSVWNRDAAFPTGQACDVASSQSDLVGCHGPPPSLLQRKRHISVTLQDARLLVEAMSSSVENKVFSPHQESVCGPSVAADGAPADLQISPHSFKSPKAVRSLVIEEDASAALSQEKLNVSPNETGSSAAPSTCVQPLQQPGSSALKTSAPSKEGDTVMITPRPSSLESCTPAAHSSTLVSAVAVKVDTTKNNGRVKSTRAPLLPQGALITSSVPVKTPFVSSSESLPVALPLGTKQHPAIKTVLPVEEQNEYSQSCFRFRGAAGLKAPQTLHLKPSAVVRLRRLPFLMSDKESVLFSRLSLGAGWVNHSVLTQDIKTLHCEISASQELPSSGSNTRQTPAVLHESAITFNHSGASAQTGNMPQNEMTSVQPVEENISFKNQEKDSTSCTKTKYSSKMRRFQKGSFKTQLGNRIKPNSEVRGEVNQHKETQTGNGMKDPQDSKVKRDTPEIVEAVASIRTDSFIQTRKSGLCHNVPGSEDKDLNDDIISPKQGQTIRNTKNATPGQSSPIRNVTSPRNIKPGMRLYDTKVIPRRLRKPRLIQDTGAPKRAEAVSNSGIIYSKPKTRAATSACVVLGRHPIQDGSSVEDNKKDSSSSSSRRTTTRGVSAKNDGSLSQVKSTRIVQAGTNPKTNVKVMNAKKLAKKAKATMVRMKTSNQQSHNSPTIRGLEDDRPGGVAVKKVRSSGVWIPPVIPTTGKESEQMPVRKEPASPRDRGGVHPPSASVHLPPVKAAPVVSPLQPLSLIGSRLLKNQCGECGQVLGSSAALESHVGLHAGRRPFSCRLCGKCFTDTKGLKRHGRVHRNGRIHVCQKCGKGFVYKFSLTKHLQMVHRRIKPFVCQICNKGFFTKLDVESHIRIHTGEKPFHCNLCERKFIRRVDLNVHLRWHNGEKRHWCSYCGKGFLDLNNLKRHKYIHTGEKPYPCTHCPKHFTQSGHLKKHVKNVHKMAGENKRKL